MKKSLLAGILAVPAVMLGTQSVAQSASQDSTMKAPADAVASDNTKSNKLASNRGTTADAQKNDSSDIDLAKRIRASVMADKSLSTYGHNVKIVAVNGTVTLNGVVSTSDEKTSIGRKAKSIAGEGHVVDEMKVAPAR
jgi:hyperosmotically inducible protein